MAKRKPARTPPAAALPDADARRRILEELDTTLLVEAAAGTGKTTCMVGRMVGLIRTGRSTVETLAAVPFTRKSAAELRARFQVALEQAARAAAGEEAERLARAVEHLDRGFIGTIHAFCGRLLRERPVEAGVGLEFEELDDTADHALREEVWGEWVARLLTAEANDLPERLDAAGLELRDLHAAFLRFADFPDVPDWPHAQPVERDLQALRRAVESYVAHMRAIEPTLPADDGQDRIPDVVQQVLRMVRHLDLDREADLMRLVEVFDQEKPPTLSREVQNAGFRKLAAAERERWKDFYSTVVQGAVAAWRAKRYHLVMEALLALRDLYARARQTRNQLNYTDLLIRAAALLQGNPTIRAYFAQRFTHLLVDEFQDTDPIQAEVMLLLTATDPHERDWRACQPRAGSLFVVGDPKQSIYRFRRADIQTYESVKSLIARHGALATLSANFRTTAAIVDWVNTVFRAQFPAASAVSPAYVELQAGRTDAHVGDLHGVRVLRLAAEESAKNEIAAETDAAALARFIRHAVAQGLTVTRGRKEADVSERAAYGDFLIVTRRKSHLALYACKLQELGVPCEVAGGSVLSELEELRLLQTCLAAVLQPENPVLLVGVLRSELFGMSDQALYAWHQAGGTFCFRDALPEHADADVRAIFADAFTRLGHYARWLQTLPAVAAVERMIADLGLAARAAAEPGGRLHAGGVCKLVEILRARAASSWSALDLAQELARILEEAPDQDAVPVRPLPCRGVRLMNLHKVKGLEAPVVFLADPTGGRRPGGPTLHVDRTGGQTRGFMAVQAGHGDHARKLIAHPADWETCAQTEAQFLDAEEWRLLYVAATRAGSMLVISQREARNGDNPWEPFADALAASPALVIPEAVEAATEPEADLAAEAPAAAADAIAARWGASRAPSYRTARAKDVDAPGPVQTTLFEVENAAAQPAPLSGEHGVEWGEVIHQLLAAAVQRPGADLLPLAATLLAERGLDSTHAQVAADTVRAVRGAEIFQRACASERMLSEVPFAFLRAGTLVRGAIDLVFRENGAWVIVDYKTDRVPAGKLETAAARHTPQIALYAEAWEACSGERVREKGLYFIQPGVYVKA